METFSNRFLSASLFWGFQYYTEGTSCVKTCIIVWCESQGLADVEEIYIRNESPARREFLMQHVIYQSSW